MSPRARLAAALGALVLLLGALAWWALADEGVGDDAPPRALPGPVRPAAIPAPLPSALLSPEPRAVEALHGQPDALPSAAAAAPATADTRRVEGRVLRKSTGEPWPRRLVLEWATGRQDDAALAALVAFGADARHLATDGEGRFDMHAVPLAASQLVVRHPDSRRLMGGVTLPGGKRDLTGLEVAADGGWSLRGTVVDEDGRVLVGAHVGVQDRWLPTAPAGEQFLLVDLPYDFPGGRMAFTAQFAGRVSETREVDVPSGPVLLDAGTIVLQAAGAVVGRVLDERGRPFPGCAPVSVVQALGPAGRPGPALSRLSAETRRPDGDYRLDGVPPGTYVLAAGAPGRHGQVFSAPVRVDAGAQSVVDFVIGPGFELHGRVELASGTAAVGHLVTLREAAPGGREESRAATGKGGHFVFRGITPGEKLLEAGGALTPAGAREYWLSLGDPQVQAPVREGLDFMIPWGHTLGGVVVGPGGLAVEGARVAATEIGAALEAALVEELTGADGRFLLEGLPSRTLALRVLHPDHASLSMAVQAGSEALRVELDKAPVAWGVVVDDAGQPVKRFSVTAPGASGARRQQVEHELGMFRVRTWRAGEQKLTVEAEGHEAVATILNARSGGLLPQRVTLPRR